MKNNCQTAQGKSGRYFAQDMQQAFIKRDIPEDSVRGDPDDQPDEKADVPQTTDRALAKGHPDGKRGRF